VFFVLWAWLKGLEVLEITSNNIEQDHGSLSDIEGAEQRLDFCDFEYRRDLLPFGALPKTEASQKPVPLDPFLARTLRTWRAHTKYKAANDWVFASPYSAGRKPYWYQSLMRNRIRILARRVGISKKMGWHTFRHTCAPLLRASGADIKVAQELLRHASCRVTLDTYTQAVTEHKRAATFFGQVD
jgi:integrase